MIQLFKSAVRTGGCMIVPGHVIVAYSRNNPNINIYGYISNNPKRMVVMELGRVPTELRPQTLWKFETFMRNTGLIPHTVFANIPFTNQQDRDTILYGLEVVGLQSVDGNSVTTFLNRLAERPTLNPWVKIVNMEFA